MTLTDTLIDLASIPAADLPPRAREMARLSLLDWIVCGRAGIREPLAEKLRALADHEGGRAEASTFGGTTRPARMAALVNGATSHALDYDDTHFAHIGHLSVGIYPAALAVGEAEGATAQDVVDAFLAGAEGAIRLGVVLGAAHYNLGFHQTATAGAFGAALAAGRLMRLDAGQMRAALGLTATRASGLKSQFGTMGKPLNAGIAAANGVEAAWLARAGFTSADDGIMGAQGFVATHTPTPSEPDGSIARFLFEDNKYKFHACCHGLHAMIEGLRTASPGVAPEDVAVFDLRTNPRWLRVCDVKAPRTGLEAKFSYNWLAGMTLRGEATGSDRTYTDALAADPALADFATRMTVTGDAWLTDMQAEGVLRLTDGREIEVAHDLAAPIAPDELAARLTEKARAILGDAGDAIWNRLSGLGDMSARDIGGMLAR